MKQPKFILPEIPEEEQTPTVKALLALLEKVLVQNQEQAEKIKLLEDEISILKGEKKRPVFKPSKMEKEASKKTKDKNKQSTQKASKKQSLIIHKTVIRKPSEPIPDNSRFKGYQDFIVQNISIQTNNTRYRMERWITPDGKVLKGKLPKDLQGRHYGSELVAYILYQYHHCQTTQPLLLEQLREWGIEMSTGQMNQLLLNKQDKFHAEKADLLKVGLAQSDYISVDDSGARHKGRNGFVTQIGNDKFAWFESGFSKNRINFLSLLNLGDEDLHLNVSALAYMKQQDLPLFVAEILAPEQGMIFENQAIWEKWLDEKNIIKQRHRRIATEGILLGSSLAHGLNPKLVVLSDDAGQFNVLTHALCWVHMERLIHKMLPLNEQHRQDLINIRSQVWELYFQLKFYQQNPDKELVQQLRESFDKLFSQKTSYQLLNSLLQRIYNNKDELLLVLDRPEVPLHTNASEGDIREYVKRRKISGPTRSDEGQKCRDTFASLKKTCRKQGISFWQYLHNRLGVENYNIPQLSLFINKLTL